MSIDNQPASVPFYRDHAGAFLDRLWGVRNGVAVIALGVGPFWSDAGKYGHRDWSEHAYAWPSERDVLLSDVEKALLSEPTDVYVCPLLRVGRKRVQHNADHHDVLWVDRDAGAQVAPEQLAGLGSVLVVESGTAGHQHVYIRLADDPDEADREALCKALATRLGDCDSKWADNDLLRLPGTPNHKRAGQRVAWSEFAGPSLTAAQLAASLNGAHNAAGSPQPAGGDAARADLPQAVREALARRCVVGERSEGHHALVGACFRAGFTHAATQTIVRRHASSVEKYGKRIDAETTRSWLSIVDERPPVLTPWQPTGVAPDPSLLDGMRNGAWLGAQEFAELQYALPGVIPEGAVLLVGAPKIGKSWFVLALALAVAEGKTMLGIKVGKARPVLYLALEDGDRRLQDRCRRLRGKEPIPALFMYLTRAKPESIVDTIKAWLAEHGAKRPLVIVDTLGKVMTPAVRGETNYERDYRVFGSLKLAIDVWAGATLLVNHHDRKAEAADFVDAVSGTHGLAGAADAAILLHRPRLSTDGTIKVTGRDVEEGEYAVEFLDGKWKLRGKDLSEAALNASKERTTASLGERSVSILEFVNSKAPDAVTAKDVADGVEGVDLDDAKDYLARLAKSGRIRRTTRGHYATVATLATGVQNNTPPQPGAPPPLFWKGVANVASVANGSTADSSSLRVRSEGDESERDTAAHATGVQDTRAVRAAAEPASSTDADAAGSDRACDRCGRSTGVEYLPVPIGEYRCELHRPDSEQSIEVNGEE